MDEPHPEYQTAEAIRQKLPLLFYDVFIEELRKIFGDGILELDDGLPMLFYVTGTVGWTRALLKTCGALNASWFYNYYDGLSRRESEILDDEIARKLARTFVKKYK